MKRDIALWAFGLIVAASPGIFLLVRAQRWGLALVTMMLLVVATPGFLMLSRGLKDAYQATRAATWPTAPAQLTHLQLVEDDQGEGPTTYMVEVQYHYKVAGKTHEGSRIAFGYSSSQNPKGHEQIYRQLARAKSVAVRYDPDDFSISCLASGVNSKTIGVTLFGFVWILFAFGVWLLLTIEHWYDSRVAESLLVQ